MYILTQKSNFFGVHIDKKYRTCLIGFREPKKAFSIRKNISKGVTRIIFLRQDLNSKFVTHDNTGIKVSKVLLNNDFDNFIEINNFMIFMVNDYKSGSDTLYLDGIMMCHDFDKTSTDYLNQL